MRSRGKLALLRAGLRQRNNAPMTPALLKASIQKGGPNPNALTRNPPSAGPTARLMLIPRLFKATAPGNSGLGTNCETTVCHAGRDTALPALVRAVMMRRLVGVMRWLETRIANTAVEAMMASSAVINSRR